MPNNHTNALQLPLQLPLEYGSFFSGIEGFGIAAEEAGWKPRFHCEINPFCQSVIKTHFDEAKIYKNIINTDFTIWRGLLDVLVGGFPCQPFSQAGLRKGTKDHRNLWPQFRRAIHEIQPRWVVGENVPGIINWSKGLVFEQVQADMEAEGYQVQPYVLPAAGVNAPHRRDRVWFVAFKENGGNIRRKDEQISAERVTSHTNRDGYQLPRPAEDRHTPCESTCQRDKRQRVWHHTGRACQPENVTDTNQFRLQTSGNTRRRSDGFENGDSQNVANASSEQLQGSQLNRSIAETRQIETNGRQFSGPVCDQWKQFPTQPPVCSGNDGLSDRLVQYLRNCGTGVLTEKEINTIVRKTITKVRTESIKAYGNAIVPQVFYQIADAINQYEVIMR